MSVRDRIRSLFTASTSGPCAPLISTPTQSGRVFELEEGAFARVMEQSGAAARGGRVQRVRVVIQVTFDPPERIEVYDLPGGRKINVTQGPRFHDVHVWWEGPWRTWWEEQVRPTNGRNRYLPDEPTVREVMRRTGARDWNIAVTSIV